MIPPRGSHPVHGHFWIAVDDVEPGMSAMAYVPRSHRIGSLGRQIDFDPARRDELSVEEMKSGSSGRPYLEMLNDFDREFVGDVVSIPINAGEANIHSGLMIHASLPNDSQRPRHALGIDLISPASRYTGCPHKEFDDIGLRPFKPFDHPHFPVIY